MKLENLNGLVQKICTDLMKVRKGLPLASAVASVNYKMSNIASQLHIRVDTKSGYQPAVVNTYTCVLLQSGGGKNSSLGLLDRYYFGNAFSYIRDRVYPIYKNDAIETLKAKGIERDLHSWTQSISNATTSGMFAYAESYNLCKFGSINIEIDEIGNAITSKAELFEQLLTPFDNGDFMPVAKRTDSNSMDISGLPVNLYAFGNKVRLFNGDNIERDFIHLIDEGYGRRFIFVDDNSMPEVKTPMEILEEMDLSEQIRAEREPDREKIKNLVTHKNFGKVLTLDRDAMLEYATIKSNSDNYISEHKGLLPAVVADISERHFKTIKLAGVYAFFDGNDTVSRDNVLQAYEVIKESSKVLKNLRRIKPLAERLLDAMLLEDKPINTQHMLGYTFINSTWTKKILEYVDLAKQIAIERGIEWVEDTHKGVTTYMAIDRSYDENNAPF